MTALSASEWDAFLTRRPNAHVLQTSAWGELKSRHGWEAARLRSGDSGAQVLFRRLPLGLTIAYIPYGPVGGDWPGLIPDLDRLCRARRAILLKAEPDLPDSPEARSQMTGLGFRPSPHTIQPPRSIAVDLTGGEAEILARMKPKTRYNVQLAARKGVTVCASADLAAFNALMRLTGRRDGFGVHSADYYAEAHRLFHPLGLCELFLAQYAGQALAGLMVFARGERAWYLYGASSDAERNRMPSYLIQWEAMRWARRRGCTRYDLWGVPDAGEPDLERDFENRRDGLWGVYRFKRGFGGQVTRTVGTWDRVYNPALYWLYAWRMEGRGNVGAGGTGGVYGRGNPAPTPSTLHGSSNASH